jgi:hypothetical protein
MLNQQSADEIANHWINAWNSRDIMQIMAHYADNIEFTSPFINTLTLCTEGKIYGKPALQAYFLKGLANFPELNFELLQALPGMTSVTLLYKSINNLLAAEVMEIDSEGKIYSVLAHYSETANLKIRTQLCE